MRGFDLIIAKTEGGGFKVYVCGQADDHLMDWHGLNLRYVSVSGQPRRGFVTYAEADHFRQEIEANSEMMKRLRRIGEGNPTKPLHHFAVGFYLLAEVVGFGVSNKSPPGLTGHRNVA